jgi:kynurenine formamidase
MGHIGAHSTCFPTTTMPPQNFIDLSIPLDASTQVYPGDPLFVNAPHANYEKDGYSVRHLSLGTHTGTHIDAPYHFIAEGQIIDKMPLDMLVSEVVVIDLSQRPSGGLGPRERITWTHLEPYIDSSSLQPGRILLINIGWSKLYYGTDKYFQHPYLAPEVAHKLLSLGIKVVGTDTLSPDETLGSSDGDGFGFHEAFLGAGGVIAENLTNLEALVEAQSRDSSDGAWIVSLVPLRLIGADGSPVRAFAYTP